MEDSLANSSWAFHAGPLPYVWWDVAIVCFLCALPLAALLAERIQQKLAFTLALAVCGLSLATGAILLLLASRPMGAWAVGGFVRPAIALSLSLPITVVAAYLWKRGTGRDGGTRRTPKPELLAAAAVMLVVPTIYVQARCRRDASHLAGLLEQSRLGEAHELAQRLVVLERGTTVEGRPLPEKLAELSMALRELESRANLPLPRPASDQELIQRALELSMLGQTGAALDLIDAEPQLATSAHAWNVRGLVFENRSEWRAAGESYQAAQRATALIPPPEQTAAAIQAWTGLGNCERKLGRYREAERAYLAVLSLSPTADSHFLLARFYEDTQQSTQARQHARQAMALAPDRYQQAGEELISQLVTHHFGCFGVFANERTR